jgi:hypothetical protein
MNLELGTNPKFEDCSKKKKKLLIYIKKGEKRKQNIFFIS